ncbi:hypothetical protein GF402_09710 [Candidatus Fermentibacteria bacterium]|nr:hypothetical protein [Candidatus Fermentibacteria bacterium]
MPFQHTLVPTLCGGWLLLAAFVAMLLAIETAQPTWEIDIQATPVGGPLLAPLSSGGMVTFIPLGDRGLGGWDENGAPLEGFPLSAGVGVNCRPAVLTRDGGSALLCYADKSGYLHLSETTGRELPGWPVDLGAPPVTGVSVLDLDEDGRFEISLGTSDSRVHLLDESGRELSGWPLELEGNLLWHPVEAILGGEEGRGLVLSLANCYIYLVSKEGRVLPGWPVNVGFAAGCNPVATDVDANGLTDVVFAAQNRRVYAVDVMGDQVDNWPFIMDDRPVRGSVAIGPLGTGMSLPQVALATRDSLVYLLNNDASLAGTWRWPNRPSGQPTSPIIVNTGRSRGVLVGCDDGYVYCWDDEGRTVDGFPLEHCQKILHSPAAGDVTGDGNLEVVVVGMHGLLKAYSISDSGSRPGPWPQLLSDHRNSGNYGATYLPTALPGEVTGEQSGRVKIGFSVEGGNYDDLIVAYSIDAGYGWNPTSNYTLQGDTLIWDTGEDLSSADLPECKVRVTPVSGDEPGIAGTTNIFRVDNNVPPTLYLEQPERLEDGRYRIYYAVEDPEADIIQLQAQYSTPGGIWRNADLSGSTLEIEPWLYGEPVTWIPGDDALDLPPDSLSLRVRAADSDPGPWDVLETLSGQAGRRLTGQILPPTSEVGGMVTLGVRLTDPGDDTLEVSYQYSVDGGETWKPATVTEPEAGAPRTYDFEIVWNSERDEPGVDLTDVRFRAIPEDFARGVAVPSSPFSVDNNISPRIRVKSPERFDVFRGLVPVRFEASDREGDDLWMAVEYRLHGSEQWLAAEGLRSSGPYPEPSYESVVDWNSSVDLPGAREVEIDMRFLAIDGDTTRSRVIGPIVLRNNSLPAVLQASVAEVDRIGGTVEVVFELGDPEQRTIDLVAAYSTDNGRTWQPADVSGNLRGLAGRSYQGSLLWRYGSHLGRGVSSAWLRLTPDAGSVIGSPRTLELSDLR